MRNRRLIEVFCSEHGFELLSLLFVYHAEDCYGDTRRWECRIRLGDVEEDFHTIRKDGDIREDIHWMFDCMTDLSCWWEC